MLYGMSIHKAFWLGVAFGGTVETVQLSGGVTFSGRELRENISFALDTMISKADIAFLRGMLAHNPHLDQDEVERTLGTCAKKHAINGRRNLTAASAVMVKQAVIELRESIAAEGRTRRS